NDFLNRMNQVGPDCEAKALAGQQPCAGILGPVFTEAIGTLAALGNNSTRIGQLVAAFLPDVMHIDTTQPSGYAAGFSGLNGPAYSGQWEPGRSWSWVFCSGHMLRQRLDRRTIIASHALREAR